MSKEKEIKHNRLKKIVDEFRGIRGWLQEHRNVLQILEKDHQLLTKDSPYKIHFAVDFHEIHKMVFPLGSNEVIAESEQKKWVQDMVIKQTGRISLFYGVETLPVPILLPPYRDELEDFLYWLKYEYKKALQQRRVINELKDSIKRWWQDEGIEISEISWDGKQPNISKENYNKIIIFIKEHFFQLSFLLTGGYAKEFEILKTLFADKRLELLSDRWGEYIDMINKESRKIPQHWRECIKRYRSESQLGTKLKERDIERANYRDLLALNMIKILNKQLKDDIKSDIVLLVSDAEIFSLVLNDSLCDSHKEHKIAGAVRVPSGEEVNILRTTRVFHTYLLVKKEREELKEYYRSFPKDECDQINQIALENVQHELRKIKLFEELGRKLDDLRQFCDQRSIKCDDGEICPKNEECSKIEKMIRDFKKDREALESIDLADKFEIYKKIYKYYNHISSIDEGTKMVLRLLFDDKKIDRLIEVELTKLREHIDKGFEPLANLSLNSTLTVKPLPSNPPVPRENFFRIITRDEELDSIIKNIQRSIRRNNQASFGKYFSELKEKNKKLQPSKSLKYLLSSLFAAAYEEYDLALFFLERGFIFTGINTPLFGEYRYLQSIIYYNKNEYENAIDLCNNLVEQYPNDPRFPHFYAYIILVAKDEDDSKLGNLMYDDAVRSCRESLSVARQIRYEDDDLKQVTLNNLIYGLSKIGTPKSIEEAEHHIEELKKCSKPLQDWGGDIWHTVGSVLLEKAILLEKQKKDYISILKEAIKHLEIANSRTSYRNKTISNDLKRAQKLLKKSAIPSNQ